MKRHNWLKISTTWLPYKTKCSYNSVTKEPINSTEWGFRTNEKFPKKDLRNFTISKKVSLSLSFWNYWQIYINFISSKSFHFYYLDWFIYKKNTAEWKTETIKTSLYSPNTNDYKCKDCIKNSMKSAIEKSMALLVSEKANSDKPNAFSESQRIKMRFASTRFICKTDD